MTTLHSTKSIGGSPLRLALALIPLMFACFALSPQARAVCQDACLTNLNTVQGDNALVNLTSGFGNTANGFQALLNNTNGGGNTASGVNALFSNMTGFNNTATGIAALFSNTTGNDNTANGVGALQSNSTGVANTGNGRSALLSNDTGNFNTANGVNALSDNTTGDLNTATGAAALLNNFTGAENTATGAAALNRNTTGRFNTANGVNALLSNQTGSSNIALGFNAGRNLNTGNSNIDIGNPGVTAEARTIRIGVQGTQTRTFVAGISGSPIMGTSVVVNSSGRLGTVASSQRFKDDIKPMDKASEAIHALKPVTFRYKQELDPEGIPQFGLVAEEVEKVNPDLVVRDDQGKVNTVRYEAVNAMLLNEFLKEHRKIQEQEATIAKLQKQIEALTAGLQRVSDELELSKPAPQMVDNNQ